MRQRLGTQHRPARMRGEMPGESGLHLLQQPQQGFFDGGFPEDFSEDPFGFPGPVGAVMPVIPTQ